ncbi:hypothetical protein [Deefgea sp. CFH1-16]|uniref:hypothetical protein n=1 Tax=Deefgea sp. CFH1-16 TaxID=2675457 RepID=UPI0015F37864|nr:hypothetical protein [Deefgea sp. CFH1-16]MBM5575588.1 hypothetical protein [Deefgea sp. CFH1-16]
MIKPFDLDQAIALPHPYTAPLMGVANYTYELSAETALLMALECLQDSRTDLDSNYREYHVWAALEYISAIVTAAGLNPDAPKPCPTTTIGGTQ